MAKHRLVNTSCRELGWVEQGAHSLLEVKLPGWEAGLRPRQQDGLGWTVTKLAEWAFKDPTEPRGRQQA